VKRSRHSYLYIELFEPIMHGTFGLDQFKLWYIDQIKDFFAEIMTGSCGFGHPCHDGIKRPRHLYLYVEPYEPIVHGTFGNRPEPLYMLAKRIITDFFAEIMAGGRGFGHPDHD
ncbi:6452_t:CDS:2, partial [Gigaspora margarita]